jgi:hypothetical protein
MKCLAVALMFAASAVTAATADESCKDQAVANKFRGDEFKSFMVNCKALMEIAREGRATKGFRMTPKTLSSSSALRMLLAANKSVGFGFGRRP